MSGEQRKFELSVPQIGGSALAAVTAAVAASYLGVAGTVIGAAIVSVASTVASAVYTHYLQRTGEKVKQHTVIARLQHAGEPELRAEGQGELATAVRATVREEEPKETTLVMAPVAPRRGPAWGRVAVAAALVFAVSMGGILAYQAVTQSTVSEQVRGESPKRVERQEAPSGDVEKGHPPSQEPRSPAPTPSVTVTVTSTPTPTPTPTVTVTTEPTPTPTSTPTESDPVPSQEQSTPDTTEATPPAEVPEPDGESGEGRQPRTVSR
ncbi:hypothetical protein [Nonomuraea sp. LPB2021202275-12-8]|uniref:hypothetical protein n=1 Tax=Nonomuraea sp. LPB2021202275-12-8 TaxID=3120159 RepID=UPI00300D3978